MLTPASRLFLAASGLATVAGLVAIAAVPSAAHPHQPPPVQLKTWIYGTRVADLTPCPPENYPTPYTFTFNKKTFEWCFFDGPYKWNDSDWYVQRIRQIYNPAVSNDPRKDVIRVCSPQARDRPANTPFEGPCSSGGVGPGGCQNCVINGVPQP
jgi:hypothetical protein